MKNNVYPSVRFPSYSEGWTIQKFKDFSVKAGKKNSKNEKFKAYSVSNKQGLISQSEQFEGSRLDDLSKESYKLVNPNDFAYNPARINVGSIAFNSLSETVLVSSLYVVTKMSKEIDNDYILQYIKSPIFNQEVRRNTEGSVREYLFYENFKNIRFPLPETKKEQIEIGLFFKEMDEMITLYQQELDALKQIKQGFLQKMFPKEGDTAPAFRFKGFNEEWIKINFYENIKKVIDFRGRTPKKIGLEWSKEGYLALSALNVKKGYIDYTVDANYGDEELYRKWMNGNELKVGQVVFTTEAPMGNVAQIPDNAGYILSQRTIAFEVNKDMITDDFLFILLSTPIVFNNLTALSSGGTAKGVSQKSLSKLAVTIPRSINEQKIIADFFIQLNQMIKLKEQELAALKQTKKGFLQKMFV